MTSPHQIRVFSVDDHPLLREGIAAVINSQSDMVMVGQAATGREAIQLFREHRPDVTLLDLRLPDLSGIDVLSAIVCRIRIPNRMDRSGFRIVAELKAKDGSRSLKRKQVKAPSWVKLIRA